MNNDIMRPKLCIIYNFAAHYRESVFICIDQSYNCDWFFGRKNGDIKRMDYSHLRGGVQELDRFSWRGLVWQKGILQLLFKNQYQQYLILAQTKDISTWVFSILARIFFHQKKVYFWSHGWYGKENHLERILKKAFFSLPNGGTFLYGNYARELMVREGLNPSKLYVIHNSLDYDHQVLVRQSISVGSVYNQHFGNTDSNLVFIGRLTPVKKLDQILLSMSLLQKKGHYYNLTLVGGGKMEDNLKELSQKLNLQDRIWFYGPCYDEFRIGELIYNADLCVSPGNVGLTAIHSLVFGTPVLTHDLFPYQMPEFEAIVPGVTGDFFRFNDIDSLAEKIDELLNMIRGSREAVRKACFAEIDKEWTPAFQMGVLKQVIKQC